MATKLKEPQGPIVDALDTLDDSINALQERVRALSLKTEHICAAPQQVVEAPAIAEVALHQPDISSVMQQRIRRMNDDMQHSIGMLHILYDTLEV